MRLRKTGTSKTFESVSSVKRAIQAGIGESWIVINDRVCADGILALGPGPYGLGLCSPGTSKNSSVKLGHCKSSSGGVTSVPALESLRCDSSLRLGPEPDPPLGPGIRLGTIRALRTLPGVGLGALPAFRRVRRSTPSPSLLRVCTPAAAAAGRLVFFLAGRPSGCEIE
ncbi:unnamed protein product [Penicillium glandicola]